MACPRCDFYKPKESSWAQLLEARSNLLRLLQEVPLAEEEHAAANGDLAALYRLVARLALQPAPSGQTPQELSHCTSCQSSARNYAHACAGYLTHPPVFLCAETAKIGYHAVQSTTHLE